MILIGGNTFFFFLQHTDAYLQTELEPGRGKFLARLKEVRTVVRLGNISDGWCCSRSFCFCWCCLPCALWSCCLWVVVVVVVFLLLLLLFSPALLLVPYAVCMPCDAPVFIMAVTVVVLLLLLLLLLSYSHCCGTVILHGCKSQPKKKTKYASGACYNMSTTVRPCRADSVLSCSCEDDDHNNSNKNSCCEPPPPPPTTRPLFSSTPPRRFSTTTSKAPRGGWASTGFFIFRRA